MTTMTSQSFYYFYKIEIIISSFHLNLRKFLLQIYLMFKKNDYHLELHNMKYINISDSLTL